MGFNNITSSINLVAKLTPLGRKRLISTNNALITTFSLGDSDANYNATFALTSGQIPSLGGNIGPMNSVSNSVTNDTNIKSFLYVNKNGSIKKSVESQSVNIITELLHNGYVTISGNNLTRLIVDRNTFDTNSYVNLYYSFGLPLNSKDDNIFTGITNAYGGYSDTAYSGLMTNKIAVIAINNTTYGEIIDGKSIKLTIPTTGGTYTLYSTFQNKNLSSNIEDTNINDTSVNAKKISNNIAFLFSDSIKTPNGGDINLTWSSGWKSNKPFSLNSKKLFNYQTNNNLKLTADTFVGVAYLDKGMLIITDPIIVSDIENTDITTGVTTGTSVTFDSVSTNIYQNITCIADRGEFGTSTNPTIGTGDSPRISEIGLYDNLNNLIAIAKTDRQIIKNVNEFYAFGIKISL